MGNITGADIRTAVTVFAAIVALLVSVITLVNLLRKEKERNQRPINELSDKVSDHETRIIKLENASTDNVTENKLMMRMLLSLLRHAIDGNNITELKSLRDEVNDFLVNK